MNKAPLKGNPKGMRSIASIELRKQILHVNLYGQFQQLQPASNVSIL